MQKNKIKRHPVYIYLFVCLFVYRCFFFFLYLYTSMRTVDHIAFQKYTSFDGLGQCCHLVEQLISAKQIQCACATCVQKVCAVTKICHLYDIAYYSGDKNYVTRNPSCMCKNLEVNQNPSKLIKPDQPNQ